MAKNIFVQSVNNTPGHRIVAVCYLSIHIIPCLLLLWHGVHLWNTFFLCSSFELSFYFSSFTHRRCLNFLWNEKTAKFPLWQDRHRIMLKTEKMVLSCFAWEQKRVDIKAYSNLCRWNKLRNLTREEGKGMHFRLFVKFWVSKCNILVSSEIFNVIVKWA